MDSVTMATMTNMKIMNLIKDSDEMQWFTPYKDFIFNISRRENQLWSCLDGQGKYIIDIDIKNNIGINIMKISFSEIDAIRILDSMSQFLTFGGGFGESMTIYINPNNTRLESPVFEFYRVILPDNQLVEEGGSNRDIRFKINQYSMVYRTDINLFTTFINEDELNELIFDIFFVGLIDIEFEQVELNHELDNILSNLYNNGIM